jgi:hypothetical protein
MKTIFEDVFGMASSCTEKFRDGVRDAFGASIVSEALEPILNEINSLRHLNAEIEGQARNIDQVLEEARSIQFKGGGEMR